MTEYNKIETVFVRDVSGTKKLIPGKFLNPTVEFLANNQWVWTEKIDGTNTRICWDGHKVTFGGRTDGSQIPAKLVNYLNDTFGGMENEELFEQKFGENEVVLYGEGYGGNIRTESGHYRDDVSFILFDVKVNDLFLERHNVEDIATTFGVDVVPIVGQGTIQEAVDFVLTQPKSTIGDADMEGVVARPLVELQDRRGRRVITKIKVRDFLPKERKVKA